MHIPISTYRLQLNRDYNFNDTKAIVSYLSGLGISDIYASPIFKARKGSMHGYDVVDPAKINPELGTEEEFNELIKELKKYRMGWLQDIVPNHMAFDMENSMLMDVLEYGKKSEFYNFFDIEWNHPYESIRGRLLAPFLGRFYGECIEDGEIQLRYDEKGLSINYYNLAFPLRIDSYSKVFTHNIEELEKRLGSDHPDFFKLLGILNILDTTVISEEVGDRYEQMSLSLKMLWEFYNNNLAIKEYIDGCIAAFNGEKGDTESYNLLDNLFSEQLFRLSFWKVAAEETNYRRFFNINELISLKIEEDDVFRYTHSYIFRLLNEGKISGVRIDHIDGLYDPMSYLNKLRSEAPDSYIVVEKILQSDENMPTSWPVSGTTGYDYMNHLNCIFCKRENEREFTRLYYRFSYLQEGSYENLVYEKKRMIIEKDMAGDIDNLAHLMKKISSRFRHGYDITLYGLRSALIEVLTLFPVYRTYIDNETFSEKDKEHIRHVIKKAKRLVPGLLYELNFIEMFLLLKMGDYLNDEERKQLIHFVMRFQQFTGPLIAKGFEDTTLYIYNRLLSLNEVGGDPSRFGIGVDEFHKFNMKRLESWPFTMNTTSTHDSKRGEDVRARLNVLSEIPNEWNAKIREWSKINRRKKKVINAMPVPDRNDEYSLYQTLIGVYPFHNEEYINRVKEYIIKAIREAKVHTAWLKPDTDYEEAHISFIDELLKPSKGNKFLELFIPFQRKIAHYGIFNSLSQVLIKITSPGIPDFYQGSELWDLNLVDPDNRRPVDYNKRKKILKKIEEKWKKDALLLINEFVSSKENGSIKLFIIFRALKTRIEKKDVFMKGEYIPIEIEGKYRNNIIAFVRKFEDLCSITVAPRFLTDVVCEDEYPVGLKIWDDTRLLLPENIPSLWKDIFTNKEISGERSLLVGEVFQYLPLSLIMS